MRTFVTILAIAVLSAAVCFGAPSDSPATSTDTAPTTMKKITPIIAVDAVEPCLLFWTGLGFEVTAEVPHEDAIGFAMLQMGDLELMYQSRASIQADLEGAGAPAGLADELAGSTTVLFVEVESVDDVLEDIEDEADLLIPRRETFYGMDEIFVRAPCGTVVGFAARMEPAED